MLYKFNSGERFRESELAKRSGVSGAALWELTSKQLETCLNIVHNLGQIRQHGFAMHSQICSVA
mgnify:CR=1 FL=1